MSHEEARLTTRHWLMAAMLLTITCVVVPMLAGFV